MTKYRKKPVVIEATKWVRNGDHPGDYDREADKEEAIENNWEGMVVRYYRRPDCDGELECDKCGFTMHNHGWIETLEGGLVCCPGDFVITGVQGEHYPCKPDIFEATYEAV